MVQNKYVFDPYPLQVTMQRLAENLKARRLEKKLSTKSLAEMSGVPASSIQRFELKHAISLESYVKLAKALGYSEEIMQLLSEPKFDTMEELLEINKNRTRKRGV
jgi:transcriptional regulator with XRE-family HTH domain